MKLLKTLYAYIIFLLLNSCTITEHIPIQVLQPAKITIPLDVQKIIIINYIIRNNESQAADSLYSSAYLDGFLNGLQYSPRYKVVNPKPVQILKNHKNRFIPLSTDTINFYLELYKADAALVLENYYLTYSDPIRIVYSNQHGFYGKLVVENSSLWKIFSKNTNSYLDDYLLKDTLIWDAYGNSDIEVLTQLPNIQEALVQSCYYAGIAYTKRIAQIWDIAYRPIYIPNNSDFNRAFTFAKNNDWMKAIEIWRKYTTYKKKRIAAMACFNMAVAAETYDNIEAALEWAAKSYFLYNDKFTELYISQLENRKMVKQTIEKQLSE